MPHPKAKSLENCFQNRTAADLYWAGFLMADGYISDQPKRSRALCCELAIKDVTHLYKMAAFLGRPPSNIFMRERRAELRCPDDSLADLIAGYGVVPRKTHVASAPGFASASVDFWRGVVDGDGHIAMHKGKCVHLELESASIALAEQFCVWLYSIGIVISPSDYRHHTGCWRVDLWAAKALTAIRALYADSHDDLALSRKRSIALSIIANGPARASKKWPAA